MTCRTEEELKSDIEHVNQCLNPLCLYSTAELISELIYREGIELFDLDESIDCCNMYAYQITGEIDIWKRSVTGPAKILVVTD